MRGPDKSTNIKINRVDWDPIRQHIKSSAENCSTGNARLTSIRGAIDVAYLKLGRDATALKIVNAVFSDETFGKPKAISDVQSMYVEFKKATTENSENTYKKYDRYLKNFIKYNSGRDKYVADITEQTYLRYCIWLKEQFNSRDYVAKNAQHLRTLLSLAANKGMINGNPAELVMLKKEDHIDTTHLSFREVQAMWEYDFSCLPLSSASKAVLVEERDAFVFCCFTGQHHIDYSTKDYELYYSGGRMWLRGYRVKSIEGIRDKLYEMPLHPMAEAVIRKYGDIDKLPTRNNAERNIRLKTIAAYCGLKINLSTKIARKTMANYCLNTLRMRQETVAAVLGLKSTKYLKHYAKITNESINAEMQFPKPGASVQLPVSMPSTYTAYSG